MSETVDLHGACDKSLFGLRVAERLKRQRGTFDGPVLVADRSVVLSDPAVAWLLDNPGTLLTTPSGRPAAVAVDPADLETGRSALAGSGSLPTVNPAAMPDMFVRKLRRRDKLLVRSVEEQGVAGIERELFGNVYKGITDVVTKYAWPEPAYWTTKLLSRLSVPPNAVTLVGIAAMLAAAWLWLEGEILSGLLFAWLMTFLDTVDGKLARVTVTSSPVGNWLDHATDIIHPPIWWACLAIGIGELHPQSATLLLEGCALLIAAYVVGRLIETAFKKTIGYNAYLWRPFDSAFRLVIARRNTILLIISVGLAAGALVGAYMVAVAWSLVSTVVQMVRFSQALRASRRGDARSWLM